MKKIGPRNEDLDKAKNIWERIFSPKEAYSFEAELIPHSEELAFLNLYLRGNKILHGNLYKGPEGKSLSLFEDYDGFSRVDYKAAFLSLSDHIKSLGVSEMVVTIDDYYCSAPTARALKKTMEIIGLKKTADMCGDFSHETSFRGHFPVSDKYAGQHSEAANA